MTDPQNILTETFDRLADQFVQSTASEIQLGLQQAIGNWQRFASGGSDSIGTLSPLASVQSLPAGHELQATATWPQADRLGDNRLLTALQDQLAALEGRASIPAAMRRPNNATRDTSASLAQTSNIAANAISQSLSRLGSSAAAGTGAPRQPGSSLGALRHDRPSLPTPNETVQRMTQSANRLLADSTTAGFASASQSPDPAAEVSAGGLETLVAKAQQASPSSPGPAVDATSSRILDRLRDAALQQWDSGERLLPFQSGLATGANRQSLDDRAKQMTGPADRGQTDRSGSQPGSSDSGVIDAEPAADQSAAAPQTPPPAAAPDPHQSAWATIQSQKADARWNNQPTDVLKPLR